MKMDFLSDAVKRWATIGLVILLVLVSALAAMMYRKQADLEASLAQMRAEAGKGDATQAASMAKLQDDIKAANGKLAKLEQARLESDKLKALLVAKEPFVNLVLETVGNTKGNEANVRVAALTSLAVIRQITRGANNPAALTLLDQALAIDGINCVARLAVNLGGARKVDVAPECAALLPAEAPAAEAMPAPENKPATEMKQTSAGHVAK